MMKQKTFVLRQKTASLLLSLLFVFTTLAPSFAQAEETVNPVAVLQNDLNNWFDYATQHLDSLDGKIKGGRILRFGTGSSVESGNIEGGNGVKQDENLLKDGLTIDNLIDEVKGGGGDYQKRQEFLNTQAGILKDYKDDKNQTAAMLIDTRSFAMYGNVNYQFLMIILELKTHAITDPNLTTQEIDNILGVTQSEYIDFLRSYRNAIWGNDDPEQIEKILTEIENDIKYEDFNLQISSLVGKLIMYDFDYQANNNNKITFKDGSELTIEKEVDLGHTHIDSFAIRKVLAELADSKKQYEHWMSFEEGSFYDLYSRWFGFPIKLFSDQQAEVIEPPAIDFLKSAYNKDDNCRISSYFDHWVPTYNNNLNNYIVLFTGKKLSTLTDISGYNYYDGHNGLDAHVRDCNSNALPEEIPGRNIYAVADGEVVTNIASEYVGYGNYVEIKHTIKTETHTDDYPDYITRYGHFVSPSSLQVGDIIKAGDFIGVSGSTGKSSGVHLHFDITRLIRDLQGNLIDSQVIDPFGWWGEEDKVVANGTGEVKDDPWELQNEYAKSSWLWETSDNVDDFDTSFFNFNNQATPWYKKTGTGSEAINNSALYAYTSYNANGTDPNFRTWDNWSFWVGSLPDAGRYEVEVHIPNYTIDGKEVSSEVRYNVFHKTDAETGIGKTPKIVNQATNQGKWVSLGNYDFEAGAKAAVQLIDEVQTPENAGKIIWADAVRWTPVNTPKISITLNGQEIHNYALDEITNANKVDFGQVDLGDSKELEFTLKNTGGVDLQISDAVILPIEIDGDSELSITKMPDTVVTGSGGTTTFKVKYTPSANGGLSEYARLNLNFANEGLSNFSIYFKGGNGAFYDVQNEDWFRRYVRYVTEQNVVEGYAGNLFKPEQHTTRAETLKMAYAGKKLDPAIIAGEPVFADVNDGDWYYKFVKDAKDKGYIQGTNECRDDQNNLICQATAEQNCFCPNEDVTRYEGAKIVHSVFTNTDYRLSDGLCAENVNDFTDVNRLDWYCEATHWLKTNEAKWKDSKWDFFSDKQALANGYQNGTFGKSDGTQVNKINRAEMAKVIANAMNFSGQTQILPMTLQDGEMTLQADSSALVSIGENYEQVIDETNSTAPAEMHLPTTDSPTISETETLDLNFETHDADGDEMFYFWNATGGSFTAIDNTKFSHISWTPPNVETTTTFVITATRGDGRGLIGEGRFEVTVKPENDLGIELVPTIHAKATGGNWNSASTWVENRVPNSSDVVEVNGTVSVIYDQTARGILVNPQATLTVYSYYTATLTVNGNILNNGIITSNYYAPFYLTVNGSFFNNGTLTNYDRGKIYLSVTGDIQNVGGWAPEQTNLKGSMGKKNIIATQPLKNTLVLNTNIELMRDLKLIGNLNLNGYTLFVPYPLNLTLTGVTSTTGEIKGDGILYITGNVNNNINVSVKEIHCAGTVQANISGQTEKMYLSGGYFSGVLTAKDVFLSGPGVKTMYGSMTINGNLTINQDVIFINRNQSLSLIINGNLVNNGQITNYFGTKYVVWNFTIRVNGMIENNGTIQTPNHFYGGLFLYIGGNIRNNGLWDPTRATLIANSELLNTTELKGKLSSGNFALIVNQPHVLIFDGSVENSLTFSGSGLVKLIGRVSYGGINGDIAEIQMFNNAINGSIQAKKIVLNQNITVSNTSILNGNVEIADGAIVKNTNKTLTLTINGNLVNNGQITNQYNDRYVLWNFAVSVKGKIENNGIIQYNNPNYGKLLLYFPDDIKNNSIWSPSSTVLTWSTTSGATAYDFQITDDNNVWKNPETLTGTSKLIVNTYLNPNKGYRWRTRALVNGVYTDWNTVKKINEYQKTQTISFAGGSVILPNNNAGVTFPPNIISQDLQIQVIELTKSVDPIPEPTANFKLLNTAYEFTATDSNSQLVTNFAENVIITLKYNPATLGEISPSSLKINYYDEVNAMWVPIPSVVDTVNHTVTAEVNHFTKFAILGSLNSAPQIISSALKQADEDALYTYQILAEDAENDLLEFALVEAPAEMTITATGGLVTWTPLQKDVGEHSVKISVSDGELKTSQEFVLTVLNVNDAPIVTQIPEQTIDEDTVFVDFDLDFYGSDEDGDELAWSLSGNSELMAEINSENFVSIAPLTNWNGQEELTFTATDPQGATGSVVVKFTVNPVNDQPTVVDQNVLTDEDTALTIPLLADDIDDDPLNFILTENPTHGVLFGTGSEVLYLPEKDYFGTDSFAYKVNDGLLDSEIAQIEITINAINDAPTISDFQGEAGTKGKDKQKVQITWQDFDPDDNALIDLYYADNNQGVDGILINSETINEDTENDFYEWNVQKIKKGDYYIYAIINDGVNAPVIFYAENPIAIKTKSTLEYDLTVDNLGQNGQHLNGGSVKINGLTQWSAEPLQTKLTAGETRKIHSKFGNKQFHFDLTADESAIYRIDTQTGEVTKTETEDEMIRVEFVYQ